MERKTMKIMPPPAPARFLFILAPLLLLPVRVADAQGPMPLAAQAANYGQPPSVPAAQGQEPAPGPQPANVGKGIVYVVDGSGRLRLMANDLATTVREAGLPLEVQEFNWSYGTYRWVSDLRSRSNHNAKGEELAGMILAHRTSLPNAKVFVITHSAGAAVAIAAAEHLPDGAVDRIIMLAPAVSPSADVQACVRASRMGVDVFYSATDLISRGLAITGTADGRNVFSAGANGFSDSEDGLRQHGYGREMGRCGHHGGHYGWTRIGFCRDYLCPMLAEGN